MKPKTAIFLVGVLLACTVFVTVRKLDLNRTDVYEPSGPLPLWSGEGSVVEIMITDNAEIVLKKQDENWRIISPINAPADAFTAQKLADMLGKLHYERSWDHNDPDRIEDSLTGLDKPKCSVKVTFDDGSVRTLRVGLPRLPQRRETYVRPEGGDTVYLVRGDLLTDLAWRIDDYRDATVLDVPADDVVRVRASGRELRGVYDIDRDGDDWLLRSPVPARASREVLNKILEGLQRVRGEDFVDSPGNLAGYGLDEERTRLLLELWLATNDDSSQDDTEATSRDDKEAKQPPADPTPVFIAFGEQSDDKVFARIADLDAVFCLDASLVQDMIEKLRDVRDMSVVRVKSQDITGIELSLNEGPAVLRRDAEQWVIDQPHQGPANADAVRKLIDAVNDLQAQRWIDADAPPAIAGLETPMCTVKLLRGDDAEPVEILIGASTTDGLTHVKLASDRPVALVKSSQAAGLWASSATYWKTDIFHMPEDMKVDRLVISRRDGEFEMHLDDSGEWVLARPAHARAHAPAVQNAIRTLKDIKAQRIISLGQNVPTRYADATHRLTAAIWATPKPSPATSTAPADGTDAEEELPDDAPQPVLVGTLEMAKLGNKAYVWLPDAQTPAVGEVGEDVYNALGGEFHDRRVWRLEQSDIVGLTVEAGDERFELRRESAGWVNVQNLDEKINTTKVDDYIREVAHLEVERFMTYEYRDDDAKRLDLHQPWMTLEIRLASEERLKLVLSARGSDTTGNRYATGGQAPGIFVLSSQEVGKMALKLADFKL